MKTIFLVCALALPAANLRADYMLLKQYIETRWPERWVVYAGPGVKLLNEGAEDTGISVVDPKTYKVKLHLWIVRSA